MTMQYKYGDRVTGYLYYNIVAVRCKNTTQNNDSCASREVIDSILNFGYIQYNFMDYKINHQDSEDPKRPYLRNEVLPAGTSIYRRHYIKKTKIIYTTDYGYVFQDNKIIEFSQHSDYLYTDVGFTNPATYQPQTYTMISLINDAKVSTYYRSFPKLQTALANIGGIIKGVFVIMSIVAKVFTDKLYHAFLSNLIFNFNYDSANESVEVLKLMKEYQEKKAKVEESKNHTKKNLIPSSRKITISSNFGAESDQPELMNVNIVKKAKINIPKKKFYLRVRDIICPKFCLQNKHDVYILEKCLALIQKKSSADFLLQKFNEIDRIKMIIFNNDHIKIFNSLTKLTLEENNVLLNDKFNEKQHAKIIKNLSVEPLQGTKKSAFFNEK